MSATPAPEVAAWIAGEPEDTLFITTICQAEILCGLAVMPEGRRRFASKPRRGPYSRRISAGACCPYTEAAAAYAEISLPAEGPVNGASVVTRDTGGFEDCGVPLIDPWQIS